MKRINGVRLIFAMIAIAILVVLIGRFFFGEADFGVTNPAWNGLSEAQTFGNVSYLYSLADLSGASPNSTLLIVGPTQNYTVSDSVAVLAFLDAGGQVVVMDDFGTSGSLLEDIASPITLDQRALCQDGSYYRSPAFPIVDGLRNESLTAGVCKLEFNHPVPLKVTDGATVLASTSSLAWIDENENNRLDGVEKFDKYPLLATSRYGAGNLIVAGDADLFINGMIDAEDNRELLANLASKDTVYIDVGHGRDVPVLAQVYLLLRENLLAQAVCIGLVCLSGWIVSRKAILLNRLYRNTPDNLGRQDLKEGVISYMKVKLPLNREEAEELQRKLRGK